MVLPPRGKRGRSRSVAVAHEDFRAAAVGGSEVNVHRAARGKRERDGFAVGRKRAAGVRVAVGGEARRDAAGEVDGIHVRRAAFEIRRVEQARSRRVPVRHDGARAVARDAARAAEHQIRRVDFGLRSRSRGEGDFRLGEKRFELPAPKLADGGENFVAQAQLRVVGIAFDENFPRERLSFGEQISSAAADTHGPHVPAPPPPLAAAVISPIAIGRIDEVRGGRIAILYEFALVKRIASTPSRFSGSLVGSSP